MSGEDKSGPASFEDLEVFKRAYRVSLLVHRASLKFPKVEQYGLADQVRRASKSICANLAEGFAKWHGSAPEFRRYVHMAIGSADEMRGPGRAIAWTWVTSTRRHGSIGAMNTRKSPRCFEVWTASPGRAQRPDP